MDNKEKTNVSHKQNQTWRIKLLTMYREYDKYMKQIDIPTWKSPETSEKHRLLNETRMQVCGWVEIPTFEHQGELWVKITQVRCNSSSISELSQLIFLI